MPTIQVINNDGGGFAESKELAAGTDLGTFFGTYMKDSEPSKFLIRVNRAPASATQVLQNGDILSITPNKVEGGKAKTRQFRIRVV